MNLIGDRACTSFEDCIASELRYLAQNVQGDLSVSFAISVSRREDSKHVLASSHGYMTCLRFVGLRHVAKVAVLCTSSECVHHARSPDRVL